MAEIRKEQVHAAEDGEFMLQPVPAAKRRSTFSQVMVWVGFGYAVTGLYVGGVLGGFGGKAGLPPMDAFLAMVLGMGSLFIITSFLGIAAHKTGLNLSLISRFSYGGRGMIIPMSVMAMLTLGWFASIVGMIGDVWGAFIGNPTGIVLFDPASMGIVSTSVITLELFLACAVWGAIFTISALIGMNAIETIANIVAPLILIIAIAVGFYLLSREGGALGFWNSASTLNGLGLGNGITCVVGSWIAGAVMGVDLFRFNKNIRAVLLCAAACFIFTNPLLNIVGYIGAVQVGQFNYVIWMLGVNFIIALVGVFVWTTSLWTTDNAELYCNSLYTGPILDSFGISVSRKTLVIICGVVGTILGSLAFYQIFFADFISVLGAVAPSLCAPILADYFVIRKNGRNKYDPAYLNNQPKYRWAGIVSFGIGAVLGFVFQYVTALPFGLPSGLFAMIISFFIYIAIYKFTPDRGADESLMSGK